MMAVILVVGAGSALPVSFYESCDDIDLVVIDQAFEPTKLSSLSELDCAMLPDPIDMTEHYIVKYKTNPFKSICEWHSQLSKQLGGNFRKVIHWKRIRSRTWTKSRKPNVICITSVAQLIFVIAFIIKL